MEENIINIKNPQEEFYKLLEIKEPRRYILLVNDEYKGRMSGIFWNAIINYFYKVEFVILKENVLYELEDIYYCRRKTDGAERN